MLQQLPLPLQAAPVGSLHCPPQQTLPPVQVAQVPPPDPQSRFVLPAWQTPFWQQPEQLPLAPHTQVPLWHPVPLGQLAQIAPPVPQNWLVLPVRQVPPSQQPVQVAGEHTLTHEPFWHCWFCPHEETQRNCPVLSAWQTWHLLVSHVLPQVPQFVTVLRAAHVPPQQLCPCPQVEMQAPVVGSHT